MEQDLSVSPQQYLFIKAVEQLPPEVPVFFTHPERWVLEITPYRDDNIWKIRYDGNAFRVYHGTTYKAYCTTGKSAIYFINKES